MQGYGKENHLEEHLGKEVKSGRPQKQAVAIALSVARKAAQKAGKRGMFTRKTMG
jgi:hypothetical protein